MLVILLQLIIKLPEMFVLVLGIVTGEKTKHLIEKGWAD